MAVPHRRKRTGNEGLLSLRVLGSLTILVVGAAALAACADDPVYIQSTPPALDFAPSNDADAGTPTPLELRVPMAVATPADDQARMALATKLGLTVDDIPDVRRDDTDLEIEWAIVNAGTMEAHATLGINAANEFFEYDNLAVVVGDGLDKEDEAQPPPLMGGRPITIPAAQTVTGVFRDADLIEAAQDLDSFTRGGYNYFRALITRWPTMDISGGMGGMLDMIPSAAIPLLLDLKISVDSDQPIRLTASLRVRDRTGRLRPMETDAAKLVAPSTMQFQPPPPPMDASKPSR
jgi:hypothetical protein